MVSNVFNSALVRFFNGGIDLDTDDIRAKLLMTGTTADTEKDAINNIIDFTTLDESDDTGYTEATLASEAVNTDDANDRGEFDANDAVFTLNGNGSRDYQGILLYKRVDGTAANDIPIAFLDFGGNQPLESTQITVTFNAEGILQISQA